ncbi:MAG: 50S ribosomal protein L19 [Candidatus Liptonbacteria bacterium]|nr:50S ribosomal protein L19 [Candidatus Liptonbacteria bacterium]
MISEEAMKKIKSGARVRVSEKGSSFEGVVIGRKHGSEQGATFTVRAIMRGVGVEKVFPLHSPVITKVDVISAPKKVHRAKLYFIRKMSGKRIQQKLGVSP